MKRSELIPLENYFAATLAETLDEWPATQAQVAAATGIPAPQISAMKSGDRRCTPEYDLRLGRYFGTSPGYWMRLQLEFEMDATDRAKGATINKIKHMKTTSLIKTLLLTCAVGIFAGAAHADERTDAAIAAAKEWLALVDSEEYKKSWQEAAPFFKEHVKEKQWEEQISSVRGPLGKAESRELLGAQFTTTLPGAPEGEYVVIQFKTSFAGKPGSVETVTPMKADGTWRVSGYFIK